MLERVMLLGGPMDGRMQVVNKDDQCFVYYEMERPSFISKPLDMMPNPRQKRYIRTTSRTMLHEDENQ